MAGKQIELLTVPYYDPDMEGVRRVANKKFLMYQEKIKGIIETYSDGKYILDTLGLR